MNCIEYIESYSFSRNKTGLHRERRLLALLGNPEKDLKFVHVAGSNGKGSTCAFMDEILRQSGYKTGLFTSPYLERFNERIRVNGEEIPIDRLEELTKRVRGAVEGDEELSGENRPSQFEIITAIAFLYYKEEKCDIVVLEVGMGGEFDATNVIEAPEVAVITNIGLEHTQYLGNTLTKIAGAKGGIVKAGRPTVLYDGEAEVKEKISGICRERSSGLVTPAFSQIQLLESSLHGQKFSYRGEEYSIGLLGSYQLNNAAMAIETASVLTGEGWKISLENIKAGLAATKWPGRFEVLSFDPLFILDGGHNPQCASAMAEAVAELLPGKKFIVVCAVMGDKDYKKVLELAGSFAERFIFVKPETSRAMEPEDLASEVSSLGHRAVSGGSVSEGLELAYKMLPTTGAAGIIAFGSLYLAGEVRHLITSKK